MPRHQWAPGQAGPHYPASAGCYGCDPDCQAGLRLRATADQHFEFIITPAHQGTPGLAHGGVLAAALDEVIGSSVWSLGGAYATARLEIDYLLPVPVGATLVLTARCTGVHGRKVYGEAEARLNAPSGPVAVRAAALYVSERQGP